MRRPVLVASLGAVCLAFAGAVSGTDVPYGLPIDDPIPPLGCVHDDMGLDPCHQIEGAYGEAIHEGDSMVAELERAVAHELNAAFKQAGAARDSTNARAKRDVGHVAAATSDAAHWAHDWAAEVSKRTVEATEGAVSDATDRARQTAIPEIALPGVKSLSMQPPGLVPVPDPADKDLKLGSVSPPLAPEIVQAGVEEVRASASGVSRLDEPSSNEATLQASRETDRSGILTTASGAHNAHWAPPVGSPAGGIIFATALAALAPAALSLYHRLRREDALESDRRRRVFDLVKSRPGSTAADIAHLIEVHYNAARHHLDLLVAFGWLVRKNAGANIYYFENRGALLPLEERLLREAETGRENAALLRFLADRPGVRQRELAQTMRLAKSTVSRRVSILERSGLIVRENGELRATPKGLLCVPPNPET